MPKGEGPEAAGHRTRHEVSQLEGVLDLVSELQGVRGAVPSPAVDRGFPLSVTSFPPASMLTALVTTSSGSVG